MFDLHLQRLLIGAAQRYARRHYPVTLAKAELYAHRADLLWDIPASGYDDATCRLFWMVALTFTNDQIRLIRVGIDLHGSIDCREYPFASHACAPPPHSPP